MVSYILSDSVEERVVKLQRRKRSMMLRLLKGKSEGAVDDAQLKDDTRLTREDLQFLFSNSPLVII